jgi:hypothetical protein
MLPSAHVLDVMPGVRHALATCLFVADWRSLVNEFSNRLAYCQKYFHTAIYGGFIYYCRLRLRLDGQAV